MMNFRLKHIEGIGWFAQTRAGLLNRWKTIGKHSGGYGLYPEKHIAYPMEHRVTAMERCRRYMEWKEASETPPTYHEVWEETT